MMNWNTEDFPELTQGAVESAEPWFTVRRKTKPKVATPLWKTSVKPPSPKEMAKRQRGFIFKDFIVESPRRRSTKAKGSSSQSLKAKAPEVLHVEPIVPAESSKAVSTPQVDSTPLVDPIKAPLSQTQLAQDQDDNAPWTIGARTKSKNQKAHAIQPVKYKAQANPLVKFKVQVTSSFKSKVQEALPVMSKVKAALPVKSNVSPLQTSPTQYSNTKEMPHTVLKASLTSKLLSTVSASSKPYDENGADDCETFPTQPNSCQDAPKKSRKRNRQNQKNNNLEHFEEVPPVPSNPSEPSEDDDENAFQRGL